MPSLEIRYYETSQGRNPVAEFIDKLPIKAAAKCTVVIDRLASGEIGNFRNAQEQLDGDIWELKVHHDRQEYRFLYAASHGVAYLLHPLHKKRQKVSRRDIDVALTRLRDLRKRGVIE